MHKRHMKATFLYYLFFAGLLLFTGCMVGKPYTQPETAPATIAYRDTAFSDTTALMTWFDLYKDTALRTMIKTTLDSNRNLLLAASRMDEAMLQTATIKANLYPSLVTGLKLVVVPPVPKRRKWAAVSMADL